jgi:hypothetical protein
VVFKGWCKNLKKIKIGYYPLSYDLSHPGDRRRLGFWANRRGINLHVNPESKMDLVIVSEKSDMFKISDRHKQTPIIYDLIDGYLVSESNIKDSARAWAKFSTGEISKFELKYTNYVAKECELATSVICSTIEQSQMIHKFNPNVHVILDSHEEFPASSGDNSSTNDAPLLWEGMPFTLSAINRLKFSLQSLDQLKINLVTDLNYFRILGRYFPASTKGLIRKNLGRFESRVDLTPWSVTNLVESVKKSSMAILPINLDDPIQLYKAENRLLIMWRLGLPCLASPTLAYSRVMKQVESDLLCKTPEEWLKKITLLQSSSSLRKETIQMGQQYLSDFHSSKAILGKWDKAIEETLDAF